MTIDEQALGFMNQVHELLATYLWDVEEMKRDGLTVGEKLVVGLQAVGLAQDLVKLVLQQDEVVLARLPHVLTHTTITLVHEEPS